MKPTFFSFKSINISWFMALTFLAILVSYLLLKLICKNDIKNDNNKEKLEDVFFWVVIGGFLSARIMYLVLHLNLFIESPTSIIKITHYNLSLIGGLIGGISIILILSTKYKINFYKLLDIFSILFFFSMAIGAWNYLFDVFMLSSSNLGNSKIRVTIMSLLFLIAGVFQLLNKRKSKYFSLFMLIITVVIYYIIKLGLIL